MAGKLTLEELKALVTSGDIDTVIAAQTDMQGRLMGKRFHAEFFADGAWQETHSCNYLQATDMEMLTVEGYKSTSWEAGYGDYTMKPDLETLRRIPWLEGTALVMCDVLDHHTHAEVPHAPRSVLKRQIARLEAMGFNAMMASELEFFLFRESYEQISDGARPTPISAYNEDYHIFQTTNFSCRNENVVLGGGEPVEVESERSGSVSLRISRRRGHATGTLREEDGRHGTQNAKNHCQHDCRSDGRHPGSS